MREGRRPSDLATLEGRRQGDGRARKRNGLPRADVLRRLLDVLQCSGSTRLMARRFRGVGTILTLHHVRQPSFDLDFSPNRILEITPEFLNETIESIANLGYDFVSLDEAEQRLTHGLTSAPFVSFTLDDGYADNLTDALPIFERHSVPFAIYVSTGLIDHELILWWQYLEDVIREHDTFSWVVEDRRHYLASGSSAQKHHAYERAYWELRKLSNDQQRHTIETLVADYGIDVARSCQATALGWSQLRELADHPLATIGAHTVSHRALAKLTPDEVRHELGHSRDIIEERLGVEVRHACYPFGDRGSAAAREFAIAGGLGFATATTTRKGVLVAEHRHHLHALPRISLNGDYQETRYTEALLSGLPTALLNRFRRLDVA